MGAVIRVQKAAEYIGQICAVSCQLSWFVNLWSQESNWSDGHFKSK